MAEIGVWRGEMSRALLRSGRLARLYLIDPWEPGVPGTSWWTSGSRMPRFKVEKWQRAHGEVVALAGGFPDVACILRTTSEQAALSVPDESLDLVFLDGDHSKEGVLVDIDAWLPKIRLGGWIGGHDYGPGGFPGVDAGVVAAFGEGVETGDDLTWWVQLSESAAP